MSTWLETLLPQSKPLSMQEIEALKHDDIPTAIVLISAGRRKGAEEYGLTETVNAETLEILRYGAFLQRKTGFPIMVVGGTPNGESTPEAVLMNQVLTEEFGAEVRWMETQGISHKNVIKISNEKLSPLNYKSLIVTSYPLSTINEGTMIITVNPTVVLQTHQHGKNDFLKIMSPISFNLNSQILRILVTR